jgi:steroid delta-isomerase-like uncharacterized protein
MSAKENKEVMRQFIKGLNEVGGDAAKMRSLHNKYFASGFVYYNPSSGNMNRKQAQQFLVDVVTSMPNFHYSIDEMVAEGDRVVVRYTAQGTHKGMFMGVPATGKKIVVEGVEIDRIVGGKVTGAWEIYDTLGMMTQLGVIPAPKIGGDTKSVHN